MNLSLPCNCLLRCLHIFWFLAQTLWDSERLFCSFECRWGGASCYWGFCRFWRFKASLTWLSAVPACFLRACTVMHSGQNSERFSQPFPIMPSTSDWWCRSRPLWKLQSPGRRWPSFWNDKSSLLFPKFYPLCMAAPTEATFSMAKFNQSMYVLSTSVPSPQA